MNVGKEKGKTMETKRYAAIDIGSNAARLLIKRLDGFTPEGSPVLTKELLLRHPLRLGFDVFSQGRVSKEKAADTLHLMQAYRHLMELYRVTDYRACATSAMRDSRNGAKLIRRIRRKTDIRIDIIDGQEEARMVYANHFERLADRTGNYIYVDVGGGSTEVNLLTDGQLVYTQSFNIGTIRLLTGGVGEGAWQRLREDIAARTKNLGTVDIIGSGGNINKYFKLAEKKDKELGRISVSTLRDTYDRLACLTAEERMARYALKPDRADVIEPAGRIFLAVADTVRADYVYVPVIGLADGIIDSLAAKDAEKRSTDGI